MDVMTVDPFHGIEFVCLLLTVQIQYVCAGLSSPPVSVTDWSRDGYEQQD